MAIVVATTTVAEATDVISLEWTAPAGCPGQDSVRTLLLEGLTDVAPVRAHGTMTTTAAGYRLVLKVDTKTTRGERVLEGTTCNALTKSAVVIVRMAVAEAAREAARPAPPLPPQGVQPEPETIAPSRAPEPTTSARNVPLDRATVRFAVRPEGTLDLGTLPAIAPGLGGALALELLAFRLEAYGAFSTIQRVAVSDQVTASFDARSVGLRGCFAFLQTRLKLGACVGVEGSSVAGRAAGVARTEDLRSGVAAGRVDAFVGVGLWARSLDLRAGVGLMVPTSRESFVIVPFGTVHERGPVAVKLWLGPEIRF